MANFSKIKSILILSLFIQIGFVSNAQDKAIFKEKTSFKDEKKYSNLVFTFSKNIEDEQIKNLYLNFINEFGNSVVSLKKISAEEFLFITNQLEIIKIKASLRRIGKSLDIKIKVLKFSKVNTKLI